MAPLMCQLRTGPSDFGFHVGFLPNQTRANLDGLHDFAGLVLSFHTLPQCFRRGNFAQAKGQGEEFIIGKLSDVVIISFPLSQQAANRTQYVVILDSCIRGFPVQTSVINAAQA